MCRSVQREATVSNTCVLQNRSFRYPLGEATKLLRQQEVAACRCRLECSQQAIWPAVTIAFFQAGSARGSQSSAIMFSLSSDIVTLLTFLAGFSFFSGLPSLIVSVLNALLVRFFTELSDVVGGEDTLGATAAATDAVSMTVDMKSRARALPLSLNIHSRLCIV